MNTARSAIFYRRLKRISKKTIEDSFKALSKNKVGRCTEKIIKKKMKVDRKPSTISFLLYKFHSEPPFLTESNLEEVKFAFLLIVEFEKYVAIMKKHVSGIEKQLGNRIERLDYEEIQYLFSTDDSKYEKLTLNSMGVSSAAILRKTLESADLRGQIPSHSSYRAIPTNTTVRTLEHRHVLRPNSSSVSKTDTKSNLRSIVKWVHQVVEDLEQEYTENPFLDSFARPISLKSLPSGIIPVGLSFNLTEIRDSLAKEDTEISYNNNKLSGKNIDSLIDYLESNVEITETDGKYHILSKKGSNIGQLCVNQKSITVRSKWLKKLQLKKGSDNTIDFQTLLNNSQLFSVTFNSPEYFYTARKVFQDKGLLVHCDEILSVITSYDFSCVSSEKGNIRDGQKSFDSSSLFFVFENNLRIHDSILICDDLGDEWSDYIEFIETPPKIRLIHCKYGSRTTSASKLHDLVGQALKNIGRTSFTKDDIERKSKTWDKEYANSSIERIRSPVARESVVDTAISAVQDINVEKEICLIATFISWADLEANLQAIKENKTVPNHLPQLVWLLSTFVGACKEHGIRPRVICSD